MGFYLGDRRQQRGFGDVPYTQAYRRVTPGRPGGLPSRAEAGAAAVIGGLLAGSVWLLTKIVPKKEAT